MTFFKQLRMTKGHNQGIMNDKRSQFSVTNDIMNNIVDDKKGHNIVNIFAHKPDGLLKTDSLSISL